MSTTNFQDFEIEIVEDSSIVNEDQIYEESFEKQANQQIVIEDNSSDLVVEELDDRQTVEISDWNSSEDFTNYIVASARNLPPTYSDSKSSYKRAFAYLEKLSNDLIQGIEQDAEYSNLSQKQLSTLDAVEEGIENALKELAACSQGKISKTATKSSNFVYYVNPFIFGLARILINGKVSEGKNLEKLFEILNRKYKLNERECLELHFILSDMGHPIRSSFVEGIDMSETYQA